MRLKILVVPFFLVMMLILSIGYIKPDFDKILEKKANILTQNDRIANIESTISHINTLNASLDNEKGSEDFLLHYLPYAMDQEQTIDAFNYIASQSGVIVTEMDLKKSSEVAIVSIAPDGSLLPDSNVPNARTFQFSGSVFGSYESIKMFLSRISHINRFQNIQSFSLQQNDQTTTTVNTTDLKGSFVVEYGYLPKKIVASALGMPVFNSEIKFSDIADLQTKITDVPDLVGQGPSNRPNPFQ